MMKTLELLPQPDDDNSNNNKQQHTNTVDD